MTDAVTGGSSLRSNSAITAIGTYVPERRLTNADLEQMVDTNDEWIVQRTGIRERRIAAPDEFTSHLACHAVDDMIERYQVSLEDTDYIIVATSTPDSIVPGVASAVQARFNIRSCGVVDIQAACAGFTAGIQLANSLLLSGIYRKILIIGAETLSKITDYTDRSTCILFGDGAGAILMETSQGDNGHVLASYSNTEGDQGHQVYCGNLSPSIGEHAITNNGKLVQNGREVYRWAISKVAEGAQRLIDTSGMQQADIDWFVPHSANQRIVDAVAAKTGFAPEQTLCGINHYGNTSAASIPLSLDEGVKAGKVLPGHILLLHGYGGGLTQAGVIVRWTIGGGKR